MSNHYSNNHLPLLILALCAVHCILDLARKPHDVLRRRPKNAGRKSRRSAVDAKLNK